MLTFKLIAKQMALVVAVALIAACGQTSSPESQPEDFQTRNIGRFGLAHSKVLALTFDDGPSRHTAQLLDMLKEQDVKASFFVLGKNARNYRNTLRRMNAEGHVIANHTKTHGDLSRVSAEVAFQEIHYTHESIKAFTGTHRLYFRAPYGAWTGTHAEFLNADPELRSYIGPIFWNAGGETKYDEGGEIISAADWECWDKGLSIATCGQGYFHETTNFGGGVVLMHDLTAKTVEMARQLIQRWVDDGYSFITLDDIHALDQYETPGS